MRIAGFTLVVIVLAAPWARAEPLSCPPRSEPLIEYLISDVYTEPPPAGEFRYAALICQSGRRLTLGSYPGLEGFTIAAGVLLNEAPATAMDDLRSALTADRVAFQQDCALEPASTLTRQVKITWFGKRGRQNSFVMSSLAAGPPCSTDALAVLDALERTGNAPLDSVIFH